MVMMIVATQLTKRIVENAKPANSNAIRPTLVFRWITNVTDKLIARIGPMKKVKIQKIIYF